MSDEVVLTGSTLTIDDVMRVSRGGVKVSVSPQALEIMQRAREIVENVAQRKSTESVFGLNTGFGQFASVHIAGDLDLLQLNLIRSHSAGCGEPLAVEQVRMLLLVRLNTLCRGSSGIRTSVLLQMVDALNKSCLSYVPSQGTFGSGDLIPMAHLALGLIGEGRMWSPETDWADAADVLRSHDLVPIRLAAKEGLSIINGTQFATALGCEAVFRARNLFYQAVFIFALTLECLKGSVLFLNAEIHALKAHPGQSATAELLRQVLPESRTITHKSALRVQDAYTLRCVPQVYGIVLDTIEFVSDIVQTELNSSSDNPLVLVEAGKCISGGNQHGEYPAKALDYLAIAVGELGNMVERRIDRLCSPGLSVDLLAFLTQNGGVNSGFMMAHVTAAALVAENRCLACPASTETLTASASYEDHVSMGGYAARKCIELVANVEQIVAIELLAACQALDLSRPLTTTPSLEALHALVRAEVCPGWMHDRVMADDMQKAVAFVKSGRVMDAIRPFLNSDFSNLPTHGRLSPSSPHELRRLLRCSEDECGRLLRENTALTRECEELRRQLLERNLSATATAVACATPAV